MKVFVDTNLFVYALDRLSPFHGPQPKFCNGSMRESWKGTARIKC